jgi:hypothetical protein
MESISVFCFGGSIACRRLPDDTRIVSRSDAGAKTFPLFLCWEQLATFMPMRSNLRFPLSIGRGAGSGKAAHGFPGGMSVHRIHVYLQSVVTALLNANFAIWRSLEIAGRDVARFWASLLISIA